jgi:hypothetical protein
MSIVAALVADGAAAQQVVNINDIEGCPVCQIEIRLMTTLHPPSERVSLLNMPPGSVAMDRQGRFIAGPATGEARLVVFDADGDFSHTVGRFGEGPGEFSDARLFIRIGANDTVHVFQGVRESVFAPGARDFVRSHNVPVLTTDPVILGRQVAFRALVWERDGRSTPVQLVDESREGVTGLGHRPGRPVPGNVSMPDRRIAAAANGKGIWVSPWTAYELSLFSFDSVELLRVIRDTEWLQPYDISLVKPYMSRQTPVVDGLAEIGQGLLLMALSFGDPGYEPITAGTDIDPFMDDRGRLDTRLEVLNVGAGELIATRVFDEYLKFVDAPDSDRTLMFSARTVSSGDLVIDIWEIVITTERR